jgi:hypothetical protein
MRIEANLQDNERRKVSGLSRSGNPFSRGFRNQEAMETWLESRQAEGYEVQQIERA